MHAQQGVGMFGPLALLCMRFHPLEMCLGALASLSLFHDCRHHTSSFYFMVADITLPPSRDAGI